MYDTYIKSVIDKIRLLTRLNAHVYIYSYILLGNLTIHL